MNSLLILDQDAPTYLAELQQYNLTDLDISATSEIDEALKAVEKANIILGQPAMVADILSRSSRLRWVQSTFAGIEPLCRKGLRTDYLLTGVKDIFGTLMREYVLGYILARERSLFETYKNQQNKVWHRIKYRSLADITLGIIGLGSIGKSIAGAADHFDMRVLGMKRTMDEVEGVEQLFLPDQLEEFLPQLDYLLLVLPDTPESRNFITRKELGMMKNDTVVINVGRGVTIDQNDLIDALANRQIGGAILDVFEEEPLPPDNPLWSMDNVIVTPHNSAYSFPAQIAEIFTDNYRRFIGGQSLRYQVDFSRGY